MRHRAQCLVSYGFIYHVGTPTLSTLNPSEQTSSVDHRAAAPLGEAVYTNSSLRAVLTNLLFFCPHDLGRGTKKRREGPMFQHPVDGSPCIWTFVNILSNADTQDSEESKSSSRSYKFCRKKIQTCMSLQSTILQNQLFK